MRKALSMLGAIAALAVGSFLAVQPAYAQSTVVCTTVPSGTQLPVVANPLPTSQGPRYVELNKINQWPRVAVAGSNPAVSHLYYCINGGNPATDGEFSIAWQAAQTIGGKGSNVPPPADVAELFYNDHLRIYFFENIAQLNSYWGTNYPSSANGGEPSAFTLGAGDPHNPNIPVGSIGILKKKSNGNVHKPNTIKGNVYHELGHAFDRLKGSPSSTATSRWYKTQSTGGIFRTEIAALNIQSRANAFGAVSASTISSTGCQAKYNDEVNYTNWQVAQCIWPYQTDFNSAGTAPLYQLNSQEFYANAFAILVGGLFWDHTDNPVMYDLGQFIADNFNDTFLYFSKTTAPLGVINGGTP